MQINFNRRLNTNSTPNPISTVSLHTKAIVTGIFAIERKAFLLVIRKLLCAALSAIIFFPALEFSGNQY